MLFKLFIRAPEASHEGDVMTEHDKEFQALARKIKELPRVAEPSSRRMDYFALIVFVLCLLIFDTETWLQQLLLVVLAVTAVLVLWFCLRVEQRTRK